MFKRIMIANRGEIAMRIIRCCHEMGIETVLACSEEDKDSLPATFSDECVVIGPARADLSYLNGPSILEAAKAKHCDAIHPGYGLLSENADFAEMCRDAGIPFIGPAPEVIRRMGDKQSARALMKRSGVPVVPGSDGLIRDAAEAAKIAARIGYPVLIKASAGGGGRGMRRAFAPDEVESAFEEARAEAAASFGDDSLYLEKLITAPRHIEFQILGDTKGHIIQLGERDCSLQRRNQKMIEEAPARCLTERQRAAMAKAAVKAAKTVGYTSAGTVEFILDRDGQFYFIEMNTRIQVEHPVTEMTVGIDILREQIRIAAGLELTVKQGDIRPSGHTIEVRVNAEAPEKGFAPSPGTIRFLHFPAGMGVRVESAMFSGAKVSPFYDSMIAKIIVHAPGRLEAIRKMRVCLEELTVEGVETNIDFLYLILHHPDYLLGNVDTAFLERDMEQLLKWDKDSRRK